MRLIGLHNVENVMAAMTYGLLCGCSLDAIRSVLHSFPGLEHALEVVRERRGVRYVNDSKGTNVDAVLKALEGIEQPIWLIAGGRDKGGDFARLRELIRQRVKGLILIGEAAGRIQAAMGDFDRCRPAATLRDAVELAAREAQPGEVVLLSPACASFDMFADYQDRGRQFKAPCTGAAGVKPAKLGGTTAERWHRTRSGHSFALVGLAPAVVQTRAGGPGAVGDHARPCTGGSRDGVQRQCRSGGEPLSRSWYFLKRQLAWLGAGLLVMHLVSKIDYALWRKLSVPIVVDDDGAAGAGACSLARQRGQGGATVAACGADQHSASRADQICGGDLCGGLCEQEAGPAHAVRPRPVASVDRPRTAQRIGPPGAGSGHGRGDGAGGRDAVVSCRGAHQTPWALCRYARCRRLRH